MRPPHSVLVLTYWGFHDALIQTYTLPYVKQIAQQLPQGSKIFLVTLDKEQPVSVPDLSEWNISVVSIPYHSFGIRGLLMWLAALRKLVRLIRSQKIRTIHAWCTPAGMIGTLLAWYTRRRLIIDSYEPHAEAMVENGSWKPNSLAFRVLMHFEKKQTHRAAWLIAATEGMKIYARKTYGHRKENFFVKPACVDLHLFSEKNIRNSELLSKLRLHDKLICVYAGKLGGIYLQREVFDFFKAAQDRWGDRFHALMLTGHPRDELQRWADEADFDTAALTTAFVAHKDIPDYIGLGNFALTPVKPVPTKRYCTPIKDGEYWALGLPVVIPGDISDDSEIIARNAIGSVIRSLDRQGYEQALTEIDALLRNSTRTELYTRIRGIAEQYRNFAVAEHVYSRIYGDHNE